MLKIRGEYWIIDGTTNFADGDVGDINHEGYALDHLRYKIADALGMDFGDMYDWDDEIENIPEAVNEKLELGMEDFDTSPSAVLELLKTHYDALDLDREDLDYAFDEPGHDVRSYMAKRYGWIVCHGNSFAVWYLTRDAAEQIAEAVEEILWEEGAIEDDNDFDAELEIRVGASGKYFSTTWKQLSNEDFSDLELHQVDPFVGPNAQVAKMDYESQHPYYQT